MRATLIILLIFIFFSCSNNENKKNALKVGMTYEEVENILGKPNSIERGFTKFINSYYSKPEVEKYGELLYVTWTYKDFQKDTLNSFLIKPKTRTDSVQTVPTIKYLINGKFYTKSDYNEVGDSLYLTQWGHIVSKYRWKQHKEIYPEETPNPVKAIKRIIRKNNYINKQIIYNDTSKVSYIINKIFSVLFDASSGRVVRKGYFPVAVE